MPLLLSEKGSLPDLMLDGQTEEGKGHSQELLRPWGGATDARGTCRGRTWLLLTRRGQVHVGCTLHQGAQPCAALPLGRGQGLAPSLQSSPCPWLGAPPSPRFGAALPALSLPAPGSLILSSWKPDSLFPSSPPLPLSLPPRQAAAPLPLPGGLWPKGARLLLPQALAPTPAHPGGPPAAVPAL